MIVLGIDTATPGLSCALVGPDGTLASFALDAGRRHTELLAPAIADLSRTSGVALRQIDAIAVDVGPGLFTGLRVGLATAAALSSALSRPTVALASTEILAQPHLRRGRDVVAVVDTRRSEVAWACFRGAEGASSSGPELATPEDLRETLAGLAAGASEVLVVGDGALRYRDVLAGSPGTPWCAGQMVIETSSPYPSAVVAAVLARQRLLDGTAVTGRLTPLYLRQADVRIGWASHDLPAGTTSHDLPAATATQAPDGPGRT